MNYRRLLTEEVVLKDQNSLTGTIIESDTAKLKLRKIDESVSVIPWNTIDTVIGKKFKTIWLGTNFGYYKIPYFSVFRNKPMTAETPGMQFKVGTALRGSKLFYLHLTVAPAQPYGVTKFGFGYQHYLGQTTYLTKNSFFVGSELNLMNAKYNNGAQTTFEPFTGYERKLNERLRIHFKLQLQFNLANKNNENGVSTTIGLHFMKKNFKKIYTKINTQKTLLRR
jgi:hypothetical protein